MRDGQDKIGVWTMLEETMEYVFSTACRVTFPRTYN